jgi:hypothetical protein
MAGSKHKRTAAPEDSEMRDEYDFRDGVRGKYASRRGDSGLRLLVALGPELSAAFGNGEEVLRVLRRVAAARKARGHVVRARRSRSRNKA